MEGNGIRLEYLNSAYYEMLGMTREERARIVGDDVTKAVHPEDREMLAAAVRELLGGKTKANILVRLRNGAGEWIWINLAASVIERNKSVMRLYASFVDCNDMMLARRQLERGQKEHQALMASIPGGVAIYRLKANGKVLTEYASEGLAKMCGYGHDEFAEYISDNAMRNVREKDVPAVLEAAKNSIETREPISINYHIHTKNGADILITLNANIIEDAELEKDDVALWYAVHTRVSDNGKQAILEQEHYRMVLNMTELAYFEWDSESGFYTSAEYSRYALSEGGMDAVMGWKNNRESVHPDDYDKLLGFIGTVGDGNENNTVKLRMKMTDGSYRWTEVVGYIEHDDNGNLKRLIGILRDIDNEWIEQNKKLQAALYEAQRANMAKSDFLSQMSHEIRTPMNGIIGMTKLAQDSVIDDRTRGYLREIDESSQYMMGLLNDVLDMSRIESGKFRINPEWVNMRDTLRPCIEMTETLMRTKGINFIHPEPIKNAGVEFFVDQLRIKQIVMNLLNNAYKFTPQGGTVEISLKNLRHDERRSCDLLLIRDTGCGMSEDFTKNGIFKPFSQEQNEYSGSLHGTGLGLALVKEIITKMDGKIEVESEQGKGTAFRIVFEYEYRLAENEKNPAHDNRLGEIRDLAGKTVLLVDDHPINRKIATALLQKAGILVVQAENGEKAIEAFKNSDVGSLAAILMDIRMPVMDGLEATRRIRALLRDDAKTVPIIAMTANAFDDDVRRSREAGMNVHLAKPVSPQLMYDTLISVVK